MRPRGEHRRPIRPGGADRTGPAIGRAATTSARSSTRRRRGARGWACCVRGLSQEARLNDIGVEIAALDVVRALKNRLQVVDWRKTHPEIAEEKVERPIFIVGQPRTGTTILFDLLAQDPALRPPLSWEVDAPLPVPQPETYETDPRIAETQATLEMSEQIIPGFMTWHPMGAQVGQECVRITASQFCSMIFSVQYRLPTYYKWLLYQADHRPCLSVPSNLPAALAVRRQRPVAVEIARAPVDARRAGGDLPRRGDRADAPRSPQGHLVGQRADQSPAPDGVRRNVHRRLRGAVVRGDRRRVAARDGNARIAAAGSGDRRAVRRFHARPVRHDQVAVRPVGPGADADRRTEDARSPGGPSRRRRRRPVQLGGHRSRRGPVARAGQRRTRTATECRPNR